MKDEITRSRIVTSANDSLYNVEIINTKVEFLIKSKKIKIINLNIH